ncbi:hypothetical protein Goarm_020649 [Gossypium armourianum]|uniref:DUF7745 domain-containing protein n=1 Tax=Gossypium armourianum TaxID=34283 RepID=A0A7J9IPB6_9ROSI|nr:hypothetical protein [Gossypium armourianum]
MKKGFLDKIEDNATVRIWSKKIQQEKSDSLTEGDLPYLLDIKVDEHLFRALAQYWNPAYNRFTFGKLDLVPTIEEYIVLLRCPKIRTDRAYSRAANVPTFLKKLMNIIRMNEQWITARIKQKGDCKCIPWRNLRDLTLAYLDVKKRVDVFTLSIYALKLEADKLRKGKNKAEEDLDSLKMDYKKLRFSMRTVGWERHQNNGDKRSKNKRIEPINRKRNTKMPRLKARIPELEKSLHQYRNCNSALELKASLNKIEELKKKIEEFKTTLQNCELRVELFEANNEHWTEQLHRSQGQLRDRDYIMGEAVA